MPRNLHDMFGSMPDGSKVPQVWPASPHALSEAIYHICRLADTMPGDSLVALSLLHSASFLVAELNERMEKYRLWIPPIPEVPIGHT